MRRAGARQNGDLGSHHFLLIMKHTPPPLVFPALAVLSIRKTEKLSDGVTAVSGTVGVSHVSVKQNMLQSLMSHWKLILALRLSILFSKDWTLASRILGRGGLWALFLSLLRIPANPKCSSWSRPSPAICLFFLFQNKTINLARLFHKWVM